MRPAAAFIDMAALASNLRAIRQHVRAPQVMAVVKANAYGHGLVEVARWYEHLGVEWLAVALVEEGMALRTAGITTPILVLGGHQPHQLPHFYTHHLDFSLGNLQMLEAVEALAQKHQTRLPVQLKIDTGMERTGVRAAEARPLLEAVARSRWVDVRGLYSHFACSDDPEHPMNRLQLEAFEAVSRVWEQLGQPLPMRHMANSGGVLHFPDAHFDCVRPGLLLYGVYPDPLSHRTVPVQPALSLKAQVSFSKTVPPGATVSYGASWQATEPTPVATLPVGYGDGYRRHLSNGGPVLFREERVPILGRVCMDQLMIATPEEAKVGEWVTLIGQEGAQEVTAEELASRTGTIAYEILTGLTERIPRVHQFPRDKA